jgi:hypothetical protein
VLPLGRCSSTSTEMVAQQIVRFRAFFYIDDGRPIYEISVYKICLSCSRNIETTDMENYIATMSLNCGIRIMESTHIYMIKKQL